MISRSYVKVKVMGQRARSHIKKRDFQGLYTVYLTCGLEVQGHWSRSNKDPKERQMGSQQRQVASLLGLHSSNIKKLVPLLAFY